MVAWKIVGRGEGMSDKLAIIVGFSLARSLFFPLKKKSTIILLFISITLLLLILTGQNRSMLENIKRL